MSKKYISIVVYLLVSIAMITLIIITDVNEPESIYFTVHTRNRPFETLWELSPDGVLSVIDKKASSFQFIHNGRRYVSFINEDGYSDTLDGTQGIYSVNLDGSDKRIVFEEFI